MKKKPNFKGWKNVFNVLIKKPATKAAKRAGKKTSKEVIKMIGWPKGKRK